jgi:two-component system, NarL family, invasion response regulator UvrY
MVTVVVADDQAPFRRAAGAVLAATPGFELLAEAISGEQAVALARSLEPDLILMDIRMPGISGIEATRRITATGPGTVVVLVSSYREHDLPADARSCGAAAYLHKDGFGRRVLEEVWNGRRPSASVRKGREEPP